MTRMARGHGGATRAKGEVGRGEEASRRGRQAGQAGDTVMSS